ncbi:hypothetical protein D9M71_646030 [compost metagenome]
MSAQQGYVARREPFIDDEVRLLQLSSHNLRKINWAKHGWLFNVQPFALSRCHAAPDGVQPLLLVQVVAIASCLRHGQQAVYFLRRLNGSRISLIGAFAQVSANHYFSLGPLRP